MSGLITEGTQIFFLSWCNFVLAHENNFCLSLIIVVSVMYYLNRHINLLFPHFIYHCDIFYFSRFLFEVQEHSEENKMGVRNLAMVFGPNILRSGVSCTKSLAWMSKHVMFPFLKDKVRSTDQTVHYIETSIFLLVFSDSYGEIKEMDSHAVTSWLVHLTLGQVVQVRALAGDIVLCSWARHFTLMF